MKNHIDKIVVGAIIMFALFIGYISYGVGYEHGFDGGQKTALTEPAMSFNLSWWTNVTWWNWEWANWSNLNIDWCDALGVFPKNIEWFCI